MPGFGAYGQGPLAPPTGGVQFPAMPNDPLNPQLYQTQRVGDPEDIGQAVYDRVNYDTAGQFETLFFATPVGGTATLIRGGAAGASVIKTYRDTNLTNQGVIPNKAFLAWGAWMVLIPQQSDPLAANTSQIADDATLLIGGSYVEFQLNDRPYFVRPLALFPNWHFIMGAGATVRTAETMVSFVASDILPIQPPAFVAPNQPFRVRMQSDGSPAVTQDYDVYFVLETSLRRPG